MMEVLRVFNNNVVLARSPAGREVILTGRGVGFQKRPGDAIAPAQIARIFVPADEHDPDHLANLLLDIPPEAVQLVSHALPAAHIEQTAADNPALVIALADHVALAITRARQGKRLEYPLAAEVRHLYPAEYAQGVQLVASINAQLAAHPEAFSAAAAHSAGAAAAPAAAARPGAAAAPVALPDSEAVALTLHLVNAGFSKGNLAYTYQMTGVIQQMLAVLESACTASLADSSANVGRFVTHLRYLFVRIAQHQQLSEPSMSKISRAIEAAYPQAMALAAKLAAIIEMRFDTALTSDETAYLALHIARLMQGSERAS